MPKFTFTCIHEDFLGKTTSKITHEINATTLSDIQSDFESFLKGCGYELDEKTDINDINMDFSNSWEPTISLYENTQDTIVLNTDEILHNSFYYDKDRNR